MINFSHEIRFNFQHQLGLPLIIEFVCYGTGEVLFYIIYICICKTSLIQQLILHWKVLKCLYVQHESYNVCNEVCNWVKDFKQGYLLLYSLSKTLKWFHKQQIKMTKISFAGYSRAIQELFNFNCYIIKYKIATLFYLENSLFQKYNQSHSWIIFPKNNLFSIQYISIYCYFSGATYRIVH